MVRMIRQTNDVTDMLKNYLLLDDVIGFTFSNTEIEKMPLAQS